jgi:hypothetical protein
MTGPSVVRPGDTLIIRVAPDVSRQRADELKRMVREAIPGLADVYVLCAEQVIVYRPDGHHDDEILSAVSQFTTGRSG